MGIGTVCHRIRYPRSANMLLAVLPLLFDPFFYNGLHIWHGHMGIYIMIYLCSI